jgi:hypothetical protein
MGDVLTADQVRLEAINAMGSPLGEIYHSLGDEVSWLHLKWNDFRELFADRETVELLNSAAATFFHDLQRQTWEDVLLHLCRLTDPPKSSGKANLTVRRLPDSVSDPQLASISRPSRTTQFKRPCLLATGETVDWLTKSSRSINRLLPQAWTKSKMPWPPFEC